jgi:1,4-dihydroxy-2-naphthoate octaprenyltransferase
VNQLATKLRFLGRVAALGRPLHLLGGWLFVELGTAIAAFNGYATDWGIFVLGLLTVSTIQLLTHYSNDYFDLDADRANTTPTAWSGGSRVLVEGDVSPQLAWTIVRGLLVAAIGLSIWLALASPAPLLTFALLALAIFLAWSYSSPPLALNRRGLGEISGGFLVPGLTTLVGFQIQAGRLELLPLLAIVPLCFFQFAMLLAVNFPDAAGDAAVGKRTLVVLLGVDRAVLVHRIVVIAPYLLLPLPILAGLPLPVAGLLLVGLPIALWLLWAIGRHDWPDQAHRDAIGFWSIGLVVGSGLLELVGILFLS